MQFYVLEVEIGSSHDTTFVQMDPIHRGGIADCRRCPDCNKPVGMLPWLPPYRAEIILHRRTFGDIAYRSGGNLLVSDKFRHAWEDAKLQGIEAFHPLERVRIRPARWAKKAVTYYYVNVRNYGGRVDLHRSRLELEKPFTCQTCHNEVGVESVRGFKIDETSWTGEDLFEPWGIGCVVVSDRVRQLRDECGLTNVMLKPTEEYFWDPYYRWSVIDYSRDEPAPPDESISSNDTSSLH